MSLLSPFTQGAIGEAELRGAIESAYARFDDPRIAPLVQIDEQEYLLELFHGPTLAFKDIAMQLLGQLFSRQLAKSGGHATVVAATSGDTGSAAIAALGDLPNVDVFVMHPKGRISEVQRRQMTTVSFPNVCNIAIEGSFDDAQWIVKELFADTAFARKINLTAVNSINFARIMAQCVYYFTAAVQLAKPAIFVVPTGNFGDIFSGEAAEHMGLEVAKLVIATNANDIMARALNDGVYAAGASRATLSPSMDIQVASNFERALFEASSRDSHWTAAAMREFAVTRRLELPPTILNALRARYSAFASNDEETRAAISSVYRHCGRVVDPHTAVGIAAVRKMKAKSPAMPAAPVVILSTAHPAKFPEAVCQATGSAPPESRRLQGLRQREEKLEILPGDPALIKRFISSRLNP